MKKRLRVTLVIGKLCRLGGDDCGETLRKREKV